MVITPLQPDEPLPAVTTKKKKIPPSAPPLPFPFPPSSSLIPSSSPNPRSNLSLHPPNLHLFPSPSCDPSLSSSSAFLFAPLPRPASNASFPMGCAGSKLDDLPAVALCRDRTNFLAEAIRQRYALADAHASYARSLRSVGAALHGFLDAAAHGPSLPPPSPVLNLPSHRKGDPMPPTSPPPTISAAAAAAAAAQQSHSHTHSHSGSHIHFHSSDESGSEGDDDSPLHSGGSSPVHHHLHDPEDEPPGGATYVDLRYARNRPAAPSVSYEQRPKSPETVHHFNAGGGDPSPSSSSPPPPYSYYGYPYPAPAQNPSFYPYPYSYGYSGYGGMGGFFGSASPPQGMSMASPPRAAPGPGSPPASKPPPPPPSPPRASTWDFLNPFESYDSYYPPYTPSRSSKEVREEEGIPDLEDEEQEVVKEAYGDQKFVASSSSSATAGEYSGKAAVPKEEGIDRVEEDLHHKPIASGAGSEYEVDVVEKNVVADEVQRPEEGRSVAAPRTYKDASDVAREIKAQFERASETAHELAKMLEVGKLPYQHKHSVYNVSSRMICIMPPSTSREMDFLDFEEDKVPGPGSLSSTLQKLYIWEKKLYEEVRAEERMRVLHDRQCKRLKRLDERGAEPYKVDSTQAMIRKLSTKIRIAIQIVESISKKINRLRDEELWPQLTELIKGLVRMWRVMLECHRTQCHAISEAKSLDSLASTIKLSDTHMEAAMQLELELLEWIGDFCSWVIAQRNYIKALNGWLLLCLNNEPEETPDGIAPFSPGRIGAPPVFVICNYWSQTLDRISEKEVVDAMQSFATNLRHIWEQHDVEQRQRMMANRDVDRWLRTREREAQTIHKAVDALNKKLVLVSGQSELSVLHQEHSAETSSIHLGLRHVFEAMENFTTNSVKAYEELHARAEEEGMVREDSKVS